MSNDKEREERDWWRKPADEIEARVAASGSQEAMRCYTDMRALLQEVARASLAASARSEPVSFTAEHVAYINRYGGRCRDCADENGVCPGRGLPCEGAPKAIQFVLEALAYGINNGYISARVHPSPPEGMVGGWRPIETAPKGDEFLVWGKYFAYAFLVSVRQEKFVTAGKVVITSATHWMPLPAPPLAAGGGREADHG